MKKDPQAFLFTLKNPFDTPPIRFNKQSGYQTYIECYANYGPTFGNSMQYSLYIDDECTKPNKNFVFLTNGSPFEYEPRLKSSIFVNSNAPDKKNYFTVSDYEVLCIDYENKYTVDHICKYPDIVWNYIQTKDIPEELLQNVEEEQDLLNDLDLVQINDDNIRLKILRYLKNPSFLLSKTKIVGDQYDDILKEWIGDYKWKLLYRASEHEYTPESFHEYCDGKSPTLIIIKSTDGWIFGGYTTQSWNGNCI